jgi:hypothetical protein
VAWAGGPGAAERAKLAVAAFEGWRCCCCYYCEEERKREREREGLRRAMLRAICLRKRLLERLRMNDLAPAGLQKAHSTWPALASRVVFTALERCACATKAFGEGVFGLISVRYSYDTCVIPVNTSLILG